MPKRKRQRIQLTSEERVFAEKAAADTTRAIRYRNRANILLLSDETTGEVGSQKQIADICQVSEVTVWHAAKDFTLYGIERAIYFEKPKRPARPPLVTDEIKEKILALTKEAPPKGSARWTVRVLTRKIVENGILPKISRETIRRTLKELNINFI